MTVRHIHCSPRNFAIGSPRNRAIGTPRRNLILRLLSLCLSSLYVIDRAGVRGTQVHAVYHVSGELPLRRTDGQV